MAVNMKLGIDVGAFKAGIADANAQIKSFDAQLKVAENTIKKYGDGETGLITKTNALNGKLETQRQVVKRYEQALKDMAAHGVDPLTKDYQLMQAAMLNAQASIMETEAALDGLSDSQAEAAQTADQMTQSLNNVSKKISLDQVISGIGAITTGLENAARRAVDFGEELFNAIMDSARWADDAATLAQMYDIPLERYLQMQRLVGSGMDTSVESMLAAQDKLARGIGKGAKETTDWLLDLGLAFQHVEKYSDEAFEFVTNDTIDMFWRAGQAIMNMGEGFDKEAAATALFGKSWKELRPLFTEYKSLEEYNAALEEQTVNSAETIRDLAALNDAVGNLESSWGVLKNEVLGYLAPALKGGAEAISGLLDKLTAYLQTDPGQELMTNMGNAVSALFEDLGNIDPDKVVENFAKLFEGVVNSFKWLEEHWGDVKNALIGIAAGFGVLKIATLALNIGKAVSGLGDLLKQGGGQQTQTPPLVIQQPRNSETTTGMPVLQGADKILNTITLFGAANAMYEATEGKVKGLVKEFDKATEGMSEENKRKYLLMHDFGWDEKDFQEYEEYKASREDPAPFDPLKTIEKAAEAVVEVADQTVKNIRAADAYTFDEHMSAEELMALVSGDKPAEVKVKPKASITFNEDLLKQLGPFVIPANVAIVGVQDISGVQMNSFLSGMGFGRGGNASPGIATTNFSSNMYIENMNMNNGMDAAGLAARMAEAQRRVSSGYGN